MDIKRNNVPKDHAKLEQNLLRRIFNPMMLLKRYNQIGKENEIDGMDIILIGTNKLWKNLKFINRLKKRKSNNKYNKKLKMDKFIKMININRQIIHSNHLIYQVSTIKY